MSSIKLYIGGSEVDLNTAPGINYNWAETDFTNPTVTKIGYSKTITLPGTKNNNNIFGHFWDLTRLQRYDGSNTGVDFNPTSKVPFTMTWNGAVMEEGYVKLQKVINDDGLISYEVGLFGGLGSFLSNLSTRFEDGQTKTLGDLQYYVSGAPTDLEFTISKETVSEAWSHIDDESSIYSTINFAPGYTGVPDKMDADKVMINFNGMNTDVIPSGTTEDNQWYGPYNGYAIGKLEDKIDGWAAKDLRSYLQTPVIRVKSIFDALQHPDNSRGSNDNGYEVELDENFFNEGNPYYEDAWMTLPKITTLTYTYGSGETQTITSHTVSQNTSYNNSDGDVIYTTTLDFALPEVVNTGGLRASIDFDLYNTVTSGNTGPTTQALYLQANYLGGTGHGTGWWQSALHTALSAQLVAYNAQGGVLRGSNINWYTSVNYDGNYFSYYDANYTPLYPTTPNPLTSFFTFVSKTGNQSLYQFYGGIKLDLDLPVGTAVVKLNIQRVPKKSDGGNTKYGNTLCPYVQSTNIPSPAFGNYNAQSSGTVSVNQFDIDTTDFYSYKFIDQKMLMNTDYSVADWLMSYCKMMGLYIHKDVVENKVYIDTRGTFYQKQKVNDIRELIDYSKKFEIRPVKTESKFYSLTNPIQENEYSKGYKSDYGYEYGEKVVDTGYDFDPGVKELLDKCKFKTAIPINKPGKYNYKVKDGINPYVYNGFEYDLYLYSNTTGTTQSVTIQPKVITALYKGYELNSSAPGFDAYYKMYWENDGKGIENKDILLFYNGKKDVSGYGYWLTDDNNQMGVLNEKPCWLMTDSSTDAAGETIAISVSSIPDFTIYHTSDSLVDASMNMGSPREVYTLPGEVELTESVTLYNQYYKRYFEDIYDVNTKVVTCYVLPKSILNENSLREFYYFDNSIWALNKIYDYNPSERDVVKMEFIKVQDVDNYCFQIKYPSISLIDLEFHEKEKIVPTISINPSSTTVSVFGNITLSASTNSDAGYFLWEVDDNTIATVSNGVVTGVHSGTTTVTVIVPATANYTSASTTCTVSVIAAVPVLSIVPASPIVGHGQDMTISASTNSSSNSFVWTSSDPGVATVTASGKSVILSGVTAGSTTVTVSMGAVDGIWETATASTTVTVSELKDPEISEIDLYLDNRGYILYHVGDYTQPQYIYYYDGEYKSNLSSPHYFKLYKEDGTQLQISNAWRNSIIDGFTENGDYLLYYEFFDKNTGSSTLLNTSNLIYIFANTETPNYPVELFVGKKNAQTGVTITTCDIIAPTLTGLTCDNNVTVIGDTTGPIKLISEEVGPNDGLRWVVGNGLDTIKPRAAFAESTNLASVTIPNATSLVASFSGCTSLSTISIPKVVSLQSSFTNSGLQSIEIPNTLTSLGENTFKGTLLREITIPDTITTIPGGLFDSCTYLSSVTLPNNTQYINPKAFSYCTSLASITFPNSLIRISESAFTWTALSSIVIPENVTAINCDAFSNTPLTRVEFLPTTPPGFCNSVLSYFLGRNNPLIIVPNTSCGAYEMAFSARPYTVTCSGGTRTVTISISSVPTVTMSCSSQNDDVLVTFQVSQNQSIVQDDEATYVYYFNAGHLEGGEWNSGSGVLNIVINATSSVELTVVASSSTSGPASHSSGTASQTITVPSGTSDYSTSISFAKTFDYSC